MLQAFICYCSFVRSFVCACVCLCLCVVHWHCTVQLSMFNMEKRFRNKIIIIIIIIIFREENQNCLFFSFWGGGGGVFVWVPTSVSSGQNCWRTVSRCGQV